MDRKAKGKEAAVIRVIVKQEADDLSQKEFAIDKDEDSSEYWQDNTKQIGKPRKRKMVLSQEERRARKREKDVARMREKRAKMTAEELRKEREANNARNKERRARMTEEERQGRRKKDAARRQHKRINLSGDQLAQNRQKRAAKARQRRANMTEEEREKKIKKNDKPLNRLRLRELRTKEKSGELTEEEKNQLDKYRAQQRNARRRRKERMTEEQKEAYRSKVRFSRVLREIKETPEMKTERKERQRNYIQKMLQDPERKKRWQEMLRRNTKKHMQTPAFVKKQQERRSNQNPEQRQKQLLGYRITRAKIQLKKRLEESGESQEEIQRRVEMLVAEMRAAPLPPPRPYRPVPQRRTKSKPGRALKMNAATFDQAHSPSQEEQGSSLAIHQDHLSRMDWAQDASPDFGVDDANDDTCDNEVGDESVTPEFACEVCLSTFTWKEDLRSHMILIHSESCWRCPKCSEVMLSPLEFSEHFKTHKSPNEVEVPTPAKVQDNQQKTLCKFDFNCLRCDKKFVLRSELSQHVKVHHPTSYWPCEHCDLLKYSERSLRFHLGMCTKLGLSHGRDS